MKEYFVIGNELKHFVHSEKWIDGLVRLDLYEQKVVRKISMHSFANDSTLQRIILPEGLEIIEECAFEKCKELQVIQLDKAVDGGVNEDEKQSDEQSESSENDEKKNLLTLQYHCFKDCQKLHTVDLSLASSLRIEAGAFFGCYALRTVILPKECDISEAAFDSCDKDVLRLGVKANSKSEQFAREHGFRYFNYG